MSLFEMRDMRELRVACQWELQLDARSCTDPMNSDMAVARGYQNGDKKRKKSRDEEKSCRGRLGKMRGGLTRKSGGEQSSRRTKTRASWAGKALANQLP
jgi:hypothetical protein